MEVAAALASTNKVIPVLLAGAVLPQTAELPEPLHSLTSRQTLTLNEASWDADVARLIDSLGLPTIGSRRSLLMAALVILAISGGLALYLQKPEATPVTDTTTLTAATTAQLVGTWESTTDVTYDWGDHYPERFEFKLFAGNVTGTASFLKYPRGIENVAVNGRNISFVTHSVESMNGQDRQLTHSYTAELDGDTLRLRLQTSGGFTSVKPIEFAARKTATAP